MPFFVKGQLETIWHLLFEVDKKNRIYTKGSTLYKLYKNILFEADSVILSGNYYNYEEYKNRLLLNYTIGFIKIEVDKLKNRK